MGKNKNKTYKFCAVVINALLKVSYSYIPGIVFFGAKSE
jgi:thiamine transporter ThiT